MRSLFVALFFLTTSAFACPNLAGRYRECRSTTGNSSGSYDMIVTQTFQNRITSYNVTATDAQTNERETIIYKADGKTTSTQYTDPESGTTVEAATTVFCIGQELNINIDLHIQGEVVGWSKVKVTKSGKQQFIASVYFDGEQEKSDKEVCE